MSVSGTEYSYCRPTVSTEDVASLQPQVVLAYQYMEPQYRAYLLQGQSIVRITYAFTPPRSNSRHIVSILD